MLKFSECGFENEGNELEVLVDKLALLRTDLRNLDRGQLPSAAALANAPYMTNWRVMLDLRACLYGDVTGHPILSDGRHVMTSELIVDARSLGWMRTASRLYRLGRPMSPEAFFDDDGTAQR